MLRSACSSSSFSIGHSSCTMIRRAVANIPKRLVTFTATAGRPRILASCDAQGHNVCFAQPSEKWLFKPYQLNHSQSISHGRTLLKDEEVPVRSPLSQVPMASMDSTGETATSTGETETSEEAPKAPKVYKENVVRAVKKRIPQSPTKVNLVATLVRGMRVDDAVIQMAVLVKRAARYVRCVLLAARANAVHNRGYNPEKLVVAEAFVGKGQYIKRVWPHGRGKSGIREKKRCMLTIKVREMTAEEEKKLARLKQRRAEGRIVARAKLLPHRIIDTRWSKPRIVRTRGGPWTVIPPKQAAPAPQYENEFR